MGSTYRRGWFNESYRHYLAAKGIASRGYYARLPAYPMNYEPFNLGEMLIKSRKEAVTAAKRGVADFEAEGKKMVVGRAKLAEERLFGRLPSAEEVQAAKTLLFSMYLKPGTIARTNDIQTLRGVETFYGFEPNILYKLIYGAEAVEEVERVPILTEVGVRKFSNIDEARKASIRMDIEQNVDFARAEFERARNQAVVADEAAQKIIKGMSADLASSEEAESAKAARGNAASLKTQAEKRLYVWMTIQRGMEEIFAGRMPELSTGFRPKMATGGGARRGGRVPGAPGAPTGGEKPVQLEIYEPEPAQYGSTEQEFQRKWAEHYAREAEGEKKMYDAEKRFI